MQDKEKNDVPEAEANVQNVTEDDLREFNERAVNDDELDSPVGSEDEGSNVSRNFNPRQ